MIKKNDFIEVDFTAKIKETGKTFDTTIAEEAKKAGMPREDVKPIRICAGQEMVIKGLDNALIGKEVEKGYSIELKPKDAFGERNPSLVRTTSEKTFIEKEIFPERGMLVTLDGVIARISSVSSGRVIVDFNNPLAGKIILYDIKIRRIISDINEKLSVLIENLLRINSADVAIKIEGKTAEIEIKNRENKEIAAILSNEKIFNEFARKTRELIDLEVKLKKEEKIIEGAKPEAKEQIEKRR